MISFKHRGNFRNTERFLRRNRSRVLPILDKYGQQGVSELAAATPKDTGKTASSWHYEVTTTKSGYSVRWYNTNMVSGTPIVILIQYGHGTKGGRFVAGRDFINPVIVPIFDNLAEEMWKEVTKV